MEPTTVAGLLDDLDAEHHDLNLLLDGLHGDDWDRFTPADGWAVRDQVSHLAYFDDVAACAMTDPAAFAPLVDAALAGDDPMEEHLRRGRALTGPEILTWWRGSATALIEAARVLPDDARVPWFGPPMGALSFLSARLMETWAHGQDIADTLGVTRRPTSRLRHIAHLGVRTRSYSYLAHDRQAPSEAVAVVLTGPAGDLWSWGDGAQGSPRVAGPALDFCLVVTQRRHVDDTALVVDGAAAVEWMSVAQAFAGPPGPGRQPTADL